MCGIAGIVARDGGSVDPARLEAMIAPLHHRGPDDSGTWRGPGVGFGHTRLSIIDLGGSQQPMATVDGRFHITFNGEILNYQELRAALDYPFRTHGDTEVVLALFSREGVRGLQRLRGQFAFAIHDDLTRQTWLVRDRLGILPLYWTRAAHEVLFGSEPKAIAAATTQSPTVDSAGLEQYLLRRSVPAPGTLVEGVAKVRPGGVVVIGPDGSVREEAWWTPPDPAELLDLSDAQAIDLLERRLTESIGEALVADVPVGAYLSGGVDSSLVVALASGLAGHPLETFCATFGDPRHDEGGFARVVSEAFATHHHEVLVRPDDFMDLWPRLSWYRDAPISEPADIAVHLLAVVAREHVKVVLSGEGSDELFGGYPKYRYAGLTGSVGRVPAGLRGPVADVVERGLPARAAKARIAVRALGRTTVHDRVEGWFAPFTPREVEALMGRPLRASVPTFGHRDTLDLMARHDLATWLPDNLLERGDRMSMAASLELRPPFLDVRLVEDALRLPNRFKVRDGQAKWLVSQVARRHLPAVITDRAKSGFKVPLDQWFRSGLQDLAHDLLLGSDSFAASVFDLTVVRGILEDHRAGRRDEEIRIWTLLSLEQWARTCLPGRWSDAAAG